MSNMINSAEPCQLHRPTEELSEIELGKIVGGAGKAKVSLHDLSITKHIDVASPK